MSKAFQKNFVMRPSKVLAKLRAIGADVLGLNQYCRKLLEDFDAAINSL